MLKAPSLAELRQFAVSFRQHLRRIKGRMWCDSSSLMKTSESLAMVFSLCATIPPQAALSSLTASLRLEMILEKTLGSMTTVSGTDIDLCALLKAS